MWLKILLILLILFWSFYTWLDACLESRTRQSARQSGMRVTESSAKRITCVLYQWMIFQQKWLCRELLGTHTDVPWCYKPVKAKVSLACSLQLLRCWFWYYKANSEIQFRNPGWAREHSTLVSHMMWPFQQEAFQEQGCHLSEAGIKPHLSEAL